MLQKKLRWTATVWPTQVFINKYLLKECILALREFSAKTEQHEKWDIHEHYQKYCIIWMQIVISEPAFSSFQGTILWATGMSLEEPRLLGFRQELEWVGTSSPMNESQKWKWSLSVIKLLWPPGTAAPRLLHPHEFSDKVHTGEVTICLHTPLSLKYLSKLL